MHNNLALLSDLYIHDCSNLPVVDVLGASLNSFFACRIAIKS